MNSPDDTNQPDSGPREWWIEDNEYNRQEPIYPSAKYTHVVDHATLVKAEAERDEWYERCHTSAEAITELIELCSQSIAERKAAEARAEKAERERDELARKWPEHLKDVALMRSRINELEAQAKRPWREGEE